MEKMEKTTFSTTNLSTAAALLATGELQLVDVVQEGSRKKMLLSPRIRAKEIYAQLRNDKLMINASKNDYWINRLKDLIFGNLTIKDLKRKVGEKYGKKIK
jgi:hypothetical protein